MNGDGMNGVALRVAMVVAGMVMGVAGCGSGGGGTPGAEPAGVTEKAGVTATAGVTDLQGMSAPAGSRRSGGACVFVKPDGAQRFGHVGWGFRVTGTDRWVYGAVENPSGRLYTPPGGDIGAWHAEGSYKKMLSEMSRDAHYPGKSEHPYSRYRCTDSARSDVRAARETIPVVEERGFLVGVDPETGELTSRDCLDATYDVLRAYRTRHLPKAAKLAIPNVWVETLAGWTDKKLTPH